MLTDEQKINLKKFCKFLESGQLKQGRGVLRREDEYCILGAACEFYRRETGSGEWIPWTLHEAFKFRPFKDPVMGSSYDEVAYLPQVVAEYFGLTRDRYHQRDDKYSWMNDHFHKSFKEIAREIRESLLK